MRQRGKTMKKVTVVFDDTELYTAVKIQAAKTNRTLKAVMAEALEAWLEAEEELEDLQDHRAAMSEYEAMGGIPWEEVKGRAREILAERLSKGVPA